MVYNSWSKPGWETIDKFETSAMQLLVTLKGIENLNVYVPEGLNQLPMIERLWDFKPSILEVIRNENDPLTALHGLYDQLPFDLQVLYRTFEVSATETDGLVLVNRWRMNPSIASLEML